MTLLLTPDDDRGEEGRQGPGVAAMGEYKEKMDPGIPRKERRKISLRKGSGEIAK